MVSFVAGKVSEPILLRLYRTRYGSRFCTGVAGIFSPTPLAE
jgi:hypothetical protein